MELEEYKEKIEFISNDFDKKFMLAVFRFVRDLIFSVDSINIDESDSQKVCIKCKSNRTRANYVMNFHIDIKNKTGNAMFIPRERSYCYEFPVDFKKDSSISSFAYIVYNRF